MIARIARPQPHPFHHDQHQPQADGQRRKDIVERDGERELETGEELNCHHVSWWGRTPWPPV